MKLLAKAALVALFVPVIAMANAFKEGVHYDVISERASKSPEVNEFFSFYCPACNSMEGILADVKPLLNKDVKFKKTHVNFMGGRSTENQEMLSQALAAAEALPQKDNIVAALFKHIHTERKSINEVADVKDIFVAQGVAADKFDKYFKSFGIRTKAKKMLKDQDFYKNKGALRSVPTFIVNGKYKINVGGKSGVRSPEDMAKLINFLAAK